jgi:hypothetical protein
LIEQRRVIREPAERDRHGPSVSPASCQPFPTTGPHPSPDWSASALPLRLRPLERATDTRRAGDFVV